MVVGSVEIDKEWTLTGGRVILFALFTTLAVEPISFFVRTWFGATIWHDHPIVMTLASLCIFPSIVACLARWLILPFMRRPAPLEPEPGLRVAAVTTFVSSGEPLDMLATTLEAMVAMDYPHDTWVLDEEDTPEVRALCERLGAHHFSRKGKPYYNRNEGSFERSSKHGNYNAWLDRIGFENYDFLAAFDPDHTPKKNFLCRVLGYFRDPEVAWVQLPQAYRNQGVNLISRGAAEETYSYNSSILMASYGLGFVTMIGCHNTHRMAALQANGGFATHEADDMLAALDYQASGWKGVFVPEILARGQTPTTWSAYLNQQRRWARSVLDIKLRRFPRSVSPLFDIRQRMIGFAHGLSYLYAGFSIPLLAGVAAYSMITGIDTAELADNLLVPAFWMGLSIVMLEGYRQTFYLDRRERGIPWRAALLQVAKWPYFVAALWDVATQRKVRYVLTPKSDQASDGAVAWPHWSLALGTLAAAGVGLLVQRSLGSVALIAGGLLTVSSTYLAVVIHRARPTDEPSAALETSVSETEAGS